MFSYSLIVSGVFSCIFGCYSSISLANSSWLLSCERLYLSSLLRMSVSVVTDFGTPGIFSWISFLFFPNVSTAAAIELNASVLATPRRSQFFYFVTEIPVLHKCFWTFVWDFCILFSFCFRLKHSRNLLRFDGSTHNFTFDRSNSDWSIRFSCDSCKYWKKN